MIIANHDDDNGDASDDDDYIKVVKEEKKDGDDDEVEPRHRKSELLLALPLQMEWSSPRIFYSSFQEYCDL